MKVTGLKFKSFLTIIFITTLSSCETDKVNTEDNLNIIQENNALFNHGYHSAKQVHNTYSKMYLVYTEKKLEDIIQNGEETNAVIIYLSSPDTTIRKGIYQVGTDTLKQSVSGGVYRIKYNTNYGEFGIEGLEFNLFEQGKISYSGVPEKPESDIDIISEKSKIVAKVSGSTILFKFP
tara:strand:+ start:67 stop:600 length:534 start_codon:yes stop_codon:yes gene_type:complete